MLRRAYYLSILPLLAASSIAAAGHNTVITVTRDTVRKPQVTSHALSSNGSGLVTVTQRDTVAPAAVVKATLSRQPVHPHLVEVQVGHTTIFLDPSTDPTRQHRYAHMTQPNYLTAALQRHEAITRGKVTSTYGRVYRANKHRMVYPRMIFLPRPQLGKPAPRVTPKGAPMPNIPQKPKREEARPRKLVASTH